jgi:hypothetical protein
MAHAAKAHALLERGDAATATRVDGDGQFPYRRSAAPEAVHVAFFGLLVAGDAVALSAGSPIGAVASVAIYVPVADDRSYPRQINPND